MLNPCLTSFFFLCDRRLSELVFPLGGHSLSTASGLGDLRNNDQGKQEDDDTTHDLERRTVAAQERSSPAVVVGGEAWVFRDATDSRAARAL